MPRGYQLDAWTALEGGIKRAALVWHRRAGKDSMSLNWAAVQAFQRVGLYWHMAPSLRQVRKIVWNGIDSVGRRNIDQAWPKALRKRTVEDEMLIELANGSMWQCVGSDNFDALVGANPVGVVFSEWSLADPRAWDFVRPILAENGGWALFIYTPRGKGAGKAILDIARSEPGWFAQVLTVKDTQAVSMDVIRQERRELIQQYGRDDAEAIIQQEWFCSFDVALRGSIFGPLIDVARRDGRIGSVPFDPSVPVNTFWDIGHSDTTAIWFHQYVGMQNRFPLAFENSGEKVAFYASYLQKMQAEHGIVYGTHYLPHDASSERIEGDSVYLQLRALLPGHRFTVVERTPDIWLGINDTRAAMASAWFDAVGCAGGITALENYRKRYNSTLDEYTDQPVHDKYSNFADALRQWGQGYAPKHQIVHAVTGDVRSTESRARRKRERNWRIA